MWLTPSDLTNINRNSDIIGRAVLVCQKFELTCRDIIPWFEATRTIESKKYEFMSPEYVSYVDYLHSLLLGQSIKKLANLKKFLNISNDRIKVLNEARKSRNWIIHESGFKNLFNKNDLDLEELIMYVGNVVIGDFWVSKWSYEFYEREVHQWINEELYLEVIVKWVISPKEDEIRETLWFFN